MTIVGMHFSTNSNGERITTLHVTEPFSAYYRSSENGKGCIGEMVESIYVGNYDCSDFTIGTEIDISYEKSIKTKNGYFQPIKSINVIG